MKIYDILITVFEGRYNKILNDAQKYNLNAIYQEVIKYYPRTSRDTILCNIFDCSCFECPYYDDRGIPRRCRSKDRIQDFLDRIN
jgi:hypothetical protein